MDVRRSLRRLVLLPGGKSHMPGHWVAMEMKRSRWIKKYLEGLAKYLASVRGEGKERNLTSKLLYGLFFPTHNCTSPSLTSHGTLLNSLHG